MTQVREIETGKYSLNASQDGNRIFASLSGFFDVNQVIAYADAAATLIRRATAAGRGYRMLIDLTDCAAQSQDVIAAFSQHVTEVPRAERLAVVAGSALVRRQIHRIIGRPEIAIFAHRSQALEWLDAPRGLESAPLLYGGQLAIAR